MFFQGHFWTWYYFECHYLKSHYIKTYINTDNWMSKTGTITLNTISVLIFTTALLRYYYHSFKSKKLKLREGEIHPFLQECSEIFAKFICSCDCNILKNWKNFLGSGPSNTIYVIYFQTFRTNLKDIFNLRDFHPVTLKKIVGNLQESTYPRWKRIFFNLSNFLMFIYFLFYH